MISTDEEWVLQVGVPRPLQVGNVRLLWTIAAPVYEWQNQATHLFCKKNMSTIQAPVLCPGFCPEYMRH